MEVHVDINLHRTGKKSESLCAAVLGGNVL